MKPMRLVVAALVVMAAWPAAETAIAGSVRAPRQVVFYADVANLVPGVPYLKNVPSVRPKLVLMFQDGHWYIGKLHWSSWGGPVARATGISRASNCIPSCAGGKWTHDPVRFVLSHRRHLFGRIVYACFQLIDPKVPATDQHDCLKHAFGRQYGYAPVAGSTLHLTDFFSSDREILRQRPGFD